MSEKILALHPEGKQGVNIDKQKYEQMKSAILESIRAAGTLPFKELSASAEERLPADWEGSVGWYTTTVKLDLETRGLIERIPGQSPQMLRVTSG